MVKGSVYWCVAQNATFVLMLEIFVSHTISNISQRIKWFLNINALWLHQNIIVGLHAPKDYLRNIWSSKKLWNACTNFLSAEKWYDQVTSGGKKFSCFDSLKTNMAYICERYNSIFYVTDVIPNIVIKVGVNV